MIRGVTGGRELFCKYFALVAACAIFLNATTLNAETFSESSLKTLFTSASERRSIDASRQGISSSDATVMPAGASSVQVTGVVKRGDNKSVVWVNGKNSMNNTMIDGVKVYPNSMKKNNKIPVRVDGRMVYIKPGETWSEESGTSDATDR